VNAPHPPPTPSVMMERQPDMYVSKLRPVTEGMGGELEIRAVLPEENSKSGEDQGSNFLEGHRLKSKPPYSGAQTKVRATSYDSHFQVANCSRRAIFLNLPTEVRGMASMKTKASGNCHLANDSARKTRNSSGVA